MTTSTYNYRVATNRNVQDHEEVVSEHRGNKREAYVAAQAYLAQSVDVENDTVNYLEDGTKTWVEVSLDEGAWQHDGGMTQVGEDEWTEAGDGSGVPDFDESDVIDYAGLVPGTEP